MSNIIYIIYRIPIWSAPLARLIGSVFWFVDIFWRFGVWGPSNPLRTVISCRAAQSLPQTDGYVSENTLLSRFSNGHAMPRPDAMAMPWPCHGMAMARLCTGEPSRDLCPGKGDMHHSAKGAFRVDETLVWNNPPDPPDPANPLQSTQNGVENRRPDPPFHARRGSGWRELEQTPSN